jgi:hypothetical protein
VHPVQLVTLGLHRLETDDLDRTLLEQGIKRIRARPQRHRPDIDNLDRRLLAGNQLKYIKHALHSLKLFYGYPAWQSRKSTSIPHRVPAGSWRKGA